MEKATVEDVIKLLAILGGIIAVIEAILSLANGKPYYKLDQLH